MWQPPISEEEAAEERGRVEVKEKDTYLLRKNDEMQHYLKNLPAAAKKHLRQKERAKQAKQQAKQHSQPQSKPAPELESHEMPAIDVLEQQLEEPTERKYDLVYDPEEDTPVIKGNQRYFLVSFLRKGINAERDWYRIWCACSGERDLQASLKTIREENPYAEWWDISAVPAGGWAPWPPKDAESQEFANQEMNDFMKHHMENLGKALKHDRERQSELQSQEDVNLRVKRERKLRKKHNRWLRQQQQRADELGIPLDELIQREGREAQFQAAMGAAQPKWDGDLAPEQQYEVVTVQREEELEDGSIQIIEEQVRMPKRDAMTKLRQEFETKEKKLLHQLAEVELRMETYALVLKQQGIDPEQVPQISWQQLQSYNEPRDEQAAVAVEKERQVWRQERLEKAKRKGK